MALLVEPSARYSIIARLSRFLSEELARHPQWIDEIGVLERPFSVDEYKSRLSGFVKDPGAVTGLDLALFRRKELLRIVTRDGLGISSVAGVTEEISNLADAILWCALETVTSAMQSRFGLPQTPAGTASAAFSVLALGKLGARELNYSSDIDLMFLYSHQGETSGPHRISNREYFRRIANSFTHLLSAYTPAGICYRVDLRLRPEGSLGEVCIPLASAKNYYLHRARDWELQMLIKARAAAGNVSLVEDLLHSLESSIYSTTLDFSTLERIAEARERIGEKLSRKRLRRNELDVKLARGGIRDIEFLVQCLQRLHGARDPSLQNRSTLSALESLHRKDVLSGTEHTRLDDAYRFLRTLEHRLQLEDDKQTHVLPADPEELERLAARLPGEPSAAKLLSDLHQHLENVQFIYDRIVHAQRPIHYHSVAHLPKPDAALSPGGEHPQSALPPALAQSLEQLFPALAACIHARGFPGSEDLLRRFTESLARGPRHLASLLGQPLLGAYVWRILAFSPFLAGQLIATPAFIEDVFRVAAQPHTTPAFEALTAPLNDTDVLHRFFRREMFRIQAASICLPEPVFQTLDRTSNLAEFLIARAYRIAVERTLERQPAYSLPKSEMMVIALGRLGMREFDLCSDADLIFVIVDSELPRREFWTRVAEQIVEILTAYTGKGPALSIDTRLRPHGREGPLVQSESNYFEYFANSAAAWEGIAYMKARGVAGDIEGSTAFLTRLQRVDWRRYGQSGRSRQDLRLMRLRLQREQGPANPLKAAQGGYYDADFILMYLRLRGAGMFFKSLNTPERIDIVEKTGHLDRSDSQLLLDATTYFRAIDHALRLLHGRPEAKLPTTRPELQMIAELMNLWTRLNPTVETLSSQLAGFQRDVHRLFEGVFHQ